MNRRVVDTDVMADQIAQAVLELAGGDPAEFAALADVLARSQILGLSASPQHVPDRARYVLKISSFGGVVAWATHYRGRVEGPYPRSCHGGTVTSFSLPDDHPAYGKAACELGHILPRQQSWDVDAPWTDAQYQAWRDGGFEADGPNQFLEKQPVIDAAVGRFLGTLPLREHDERWRGIPPGAELYLDFVAADESEIDETWDPPLRYGALLARRPDREEPCGSARQEEDATCLSQ